MAKKIVALGGGHGLSMVLESLRPTDNEITAIVSVADDGGSSGRLRHDLDIVAPGDIRACMLALTPNENLADSELFRKVFGYRFDKGELDGHSMGNLILVALARELGSFEAAVKAASKLLNIYGTVLPATESSVVLVAKTAHGLVRGQVEIEKTSGIEQVMLEPDDALPLAGVVESILNADEIILAPGSLFTSVIPAFIIPEITQALKMAPAKITMILNLINRGPDTTGLTGDDHLAKVIQHGAKVDRVIYDDNSLKVLDPPAGVEAIAGHISNDTDVHDPILLKTLLCEILDL